MVTGGKQRRKQPEAALQRAVMEALRLVLLPQRSIVFAVPNGGARRPAEAAILIGQGVVPGIPDLIVLFDSTGAGLELKAGKGQLTEQQRDVHARFAAAGIPVAVVRTVGEALDFLKQCGAPMRLVGGA
jgi:hypothetical protein